MPKQLSLSQHNFHFLKTIICKKGLQVYGGLTLTCNSRLPLPMDGRHSLHLGKNIICLEKKELGSDWPRLSRLQTVDERPPPPRQVVDVVYNRHSTTVEASMKGFVLREGSGTTKFPLRGSPPEGNYNLATHTSSAFSSPPPCFASGLRSVAPSFLHPTKGSSFPGRCC